MSSILDKCAEMEEQTLNAKQEDKTTATSDERSRIEDSLFGGNRQISLMSSKTPTSILKDTLIMYIRSILAGMLIGLAGATYLAVPNQVIGALMFAFGLITIIAFDLPLFTGKIGYLFHNKDVTVANLLIMLFGNCVGTNIMSWIIIPTQFWSKIDYRVDMLVYNTISCTWYSTLLAAIGCGMFMYVAVEGSRIYKDIRGMVITVFSVMGFILTGALHSIANMFYIYVCRSTEFIQSASMDYRPMGWIAIMVVGNAIGAQLISWMRCQGPVKPTFFK